MVSNREIAEMMRQEDWSYSVVKEPTMLRADEARAKALSLTNKAAQEFFTTVQNAIDRAVGNSELSTSVNCDSRKQTVVDVVITRLKEYKYQVKQEKDSDCRGDSWNYLQISW